MVAAKQSVLYVCLVFLLITGCSLPPYSGRADSAALASDVANETALGRAIAPKRIEYPGLSGIYPLSNGPDAFAARMLLARFAELTIDAQYYMWHGDTTGSLLLTELLAAAQRGVRVRILVDDNGTQGLDAVLAALNTHPNIQIRIFNPFAQRRMKWLGFLYDFSRLNRRMHNKSFTVDNQVTVIGGRNIGDEYFGASNGVLFADLDVLAIGPVVPEVSQDFDRYWASSSAYPVELILPAGQAIALSGLQHYADEQLASSIGQQYRRAVEQSQIHRQLGDGSLPMHWASVLMLSDDPAKIKGNSSAETLLINKLDRVLGKPQHSLLLVSPYFVPTEEGSQYFANLARQGVDVQVLTNSLAATDVSVVHAGYAKWRKFLLKNGVQLREMRRAADVERASKRQGFGALGASLHAKTFAVDAQRVFVGSMNFDPRSVALNAELGFIIDSPDLAAEVNHVFSKDLPNWAYRVELDDNDRLLWHWQNGFDSGVYDAEPEVNWWQSLFVRFISMMGIDWML